MFGGGGCIHVMYYNNMSVFQCVRMDLLSILCHRESILIYSNYTLPCFCNILSPGYLVHVWCFIVFGVSLYVSVCICVSV